MLAQISSPDLWGQLGWIRCGGRRDGHSHCGGQTEKKNHSFAGMASTFAHLPATLTWPMSWRNCTREGGCASSFCAVVSGLIFFSLRESISLDPALQNGT